MDERGRYGFSEKKGQVTIFIVIGIIIVFMIVLFIILFYKDKPDEPSPSSEIQSNSFLEHCLKDDVEEAIRHISLRGGYINNSLNIPYRFGDEPGRNISYLCYKEVDYLPCVNQEPLLFIRLEKEIKKYINASVEECHNDLVVSFEKKGFDVTDHYNDFNVSLLPRRVEILIDAEITAEKGEESLREDLFKVEVRTRLYGIANVVQDIVRSQIAAAGRFDENNYLFWHPQFSIESTPTRDDSRIYTILNKESDEKFRFAVIGSVLRPEFI